MNKHTNEQQETPGMILCKFYRKLCKYGVKSHIHLSENNKTKHHIKIESVRINIALTVTATEDGQLEIMTADQNRRILAAPGAAIGIITDLARKEPA